MKCNYDTIFDDDINDSHLTILKVDVNDAIYLYDKYKPDLIENYSMARAQHKLFFYYRKIEFENCDKKENQNSAYNVIKLSDILKSDRTNEYSFSIILLDIENGTDIELMNHSQSIYRFYGSIFIPLNGYNEYSSITFLDYTLYRNIFYKMPRSMRIYLNGIENDYITFIKSECTLVMNKLKFRYLSRSINGIDVIDSYDTDDPLDSIRNFNEKRGLIEQGFDLRRELNFIVEEVVEATNISIGSDKAKEKAKVIVDELLKECVTTNENSLDAFIDIIVFAVGALYKLAPRMNIDVKEEIMKVIRNIEFKPYIKDENGKVIKDPNYKKYREK